MARWIGSWGLLLTGIAFISCSEDKSSNEKAGATQELDYDGNTSLYCDNGITMYSVWIKNGLIVDQKTATVQSECVDAVPQTSFLCEKSGENYVLKAKFKGEIANSGSLGAYPTSEICEGYSQALKSKRPS